MSSLTPSDLFTAVSLDSDAQNHTDLCSSVPPNTKPDLPNMSPITPSEPSTALNIESVARNVTQTRCIAPNIASKITHVSSFRESVTMESDASNVTQLISFPSSTHSVGSITPTMTCKHYDAPTKYHMSIIAQHAGDCKSWMFLKKDLMRSAHEAGHTIVANGGGDRHSLLCSHSHRDFKSKAMQLTDDNKYRNTTLIGNDKENRRIDGKSKPRRRNISIENIGVLSVLM
eukprot:CCRYP_011047-RA/>CCRYP_011047-RA protein AED:0.77 eAED:0.77 QI:0/-1/0/1/-1/1/1/0/229